MAIGPCLRVLCLLATAIMVLSAFPPTIGNVEATLPGSCTSSRGHWEGYFPSSTSAFINQSIEKHNYDTQAEIALSTNVNQTTLNGGIYETTLAVVMAANTRHVMTYDSQWSIQTDPVVYIPGTFKSVLKPDGTKLGDNEGAWIFLNTAFPYYGAWYDMAWVTSNGFLVLDNHEHYMKAQTYYPEWTSKWAESFPIMSSNYEPMTIVAPWWRDLNPTKCPSDGGIFYGPGPSGFMSIVWWKVPNANGPGHLQTFSVEFQHTTSASSNGNIKFCYKAITTPAVNNDKSPTSVGIQDQTARRGLNLQPSPPQYVKNNDVIQLYCPNQNYKVKKVEMFAYKYAAASDTNDANAAVLVGGFGSSILVPEGMNVERGTGPVVGGYSKWPALVDGCGLAIGAVEMMGTALGYGSFAVLGPIGFGLGALTFAYSMYESKSSTPRGTIVDPADYLETTPAKTVNYALDNWTVPGITNYYAWDVAVAPKLTWCIKSASANEVHRLVITSRVTYCYFPSGSGDTTVETSMELKMGPSGVSGGATWLARADPAAINEGRYYNFYPITADLPTGNAPGWRIDTNGYPPDGSPGYQDRYYAYMGYGPERLGYLEGYSTRADGSICVSGWFKQAYNFVTSPGVSVFILNKDLQSVPQDYGRTIIQPTDPVTWQYKMASFEGLGNQKVKIGIGSYDGITLDDNTHVSWAETRVFCRESDGFDHYCLYIPSTSSSKGSVTLASYPGQSGYEVHSYVYNQVDTITATPVTTGYRVNYWLVDGVQSYLGQSSIPVTMNRDHQIEPVFASSSNPTFKLTISVMGTGTTDPRPGVYYYESGSKVQITALPPNQYFLYCWYVDGVETNAGGGKITVTMDQDHIVIANFARKHK